MTAYLTCDRCHARSLSDAATAYNYGRWRAGWDARTRPAVTLQVLFDAQPAVAYDFCPTCAPDVTVLGGWSLIEPAGDPFAPVAPDAEFTPVTFQRRSWVRITRGVFIWFTFFLNIYLGHMFLRWWEHTR